MKQASFITIATLVITTALWVAGRITQGLTEELWPWGDVPRDVETFLAALPPLSR